MVDGGDSLLGEASMADNQVAFSGLSVPVPAAGKVTMLLEVTISEDTVTMTRIKYAIPEAGLTVDGTPEGLPLAGAKFTVATDVDGDVDGDTDSVVDGDTTDNLDWDNNWDNTVDGDTDEPDGSSDGGCSGLASGASFLLLGPWLWACGVVAATDCNTRGRNPQGFRPSFTKNVGMVLDLACVVLGIAFAAFGHFTGFLAQAVKNRCIACGLCACGHGNPPAGSPAGRVFSGQRPPRCWWCLALPGC